MQGRNIPKEFKKYKNIVFISSIIISKIRSSLLNEKGNLAHNLGYMTLNLKYYYTIDRTLNCSQL